MKRVEAAASCFEAGFNCAQAILSTYGLEFGLDRETALRVAAPLGGGMGRMGHVCGAVSGAYIVLGLRHGGTRSRRKASKASKERVYRFVREFADRFTARNGSTICRELVGCEIRTPAGRRRAREQHLFKTRCPRFVRDAAEIIEELIA